jgi:hypothetical protein
LRAATPFTEAAVERQEAATRGNEMTSDEDFMKMTDPDFLAERRRVRDVLEHTPEHSVSTEMKERYLRLDEEFLRRARISWAGGK